MHGSNATGRIIWFRQGGRIEEHRLTANVCLQKTLAASAPLWIISLDPSKAFDKVDWNALWSALREHGISEHLIWVLQCVYYGQTGVVRERDVDSCGFDIRGGVRQGCVLSPRLFSAVLEMALSSWRAKMEAEGLSLEDGLRPLLDLRFADDILVFCVDSRESLSLFHLFTMIGLGRLLVFLFVCGGGLFFWFC